MLGHNAAGLADCTSSCDAGARSADIVFNASTFNDTRVVTIQGEDDNKVDGNAMFTVSVVAQLLLMDGSTRSVMAENVNPSVVFCTNEDNDSPGIKLVLPAANTRFTTENEVSFTFAIKLNTVPAAPVHVTVSSSNTAEGVVVGRSESRAAVVASIATSVRCGARPLGIARATQRTACPHARTRRVPRAINPQVAHARRSEDAAAAAWSHAHARVHH